MIPIASLIRVQDIDHCGIVAGIIDQMGLVEQINQELRTHTQENLSAGVAVKAMILNGLGLVSAPREHLTFVTPKSGFMSSYFESLARNQF
jgi:hypothetical protein